MSYYAPFYRQSNYYNPSVPMQNQMPNGMPNAMPNVADNQQFAPAQPTNDMIWVLNENEATSYPVAPNNTVVMWDRNQNTAYIKSANAQGVPSMEILDYTKRTLNGSKTPELDELNLGDKFVTKEQFSALQGEFDELLKRFNETSVTQTTKTTKTSKKGEE